MDSLFSVHTPSCLDCQSSLTNVALVSCLEWPKIKIVGGSSKQNKQKEKKYIIRAFGSNCSYFLSLAIYFLHVSLLSSSLIGSWIPATTVCKYEGPCPEVLIFFLPVLLAPHAFSRVKDIFSYKKNGFKQG